MDGQIEHIIHDSISSFPPSSLWEVRNITKSANFYAHYVAYRAAAKIFPDYIPSLVFPPSSIPICNGKDLPLFNPP
jgi:hypothetical protein